MAHMLSRFRCHQTAGGDCLRWYLQPNLRRPRQLLLCGQRFFGNRSERAAVDATGPLRSWRVWAELEKHDERLKLRMAQLLHDLHDLAAERYRSRNRGGSPEPRRTPTSDTGLGSLDLGSLASAASLLVRRPSYRHNFDINKPQPEDVQNTIDAFSDDTLLHADSLRKLLKATADVLSAEPTVLDLRSRNTVHVVGDLHGCYDSLKEVLRVSEPPSSKNALIFNGDFVDRGSYGVEVLATLCLLKLAYPQDVFLLRGNHEDGFLATVYGFREEVENKYPSKVEAIWDSILDAFGSLPICAVTPEAFVVHGGLCSADLSIAEVEQVSLKQRKFPSVLRRLGGDKKWSAWKVPREQMMILQMLWADPTEEDNGMSQNTRRGSTTVQYGTDVARDFLKRHGLKYLVRSHEAKFRGFDFINSGGDTHVITVFSAANYPGGTGQNNGAVLRLCTGVTPEPLVYSIEVTSESETRGKSNEKTIMEFVVAHKQRLRDAFQQLDPSNCGLVTVAQWAQAMQTVLGLDLDWKALQPLLVQTETPQDSSPTGASGDTGLIDYSGFLRQYVLMSSSVHPSDEPGDENLAAVREALYRNHEELSIVFQFLDTDGNGVLSREEFTAGVNLLNERLPAEENIEDADAMFDTLDLDGSGVVALDEFCETFKAG